MKISIDFGGCYTEHKAFFDEMAKGMQAMGHKVGIVTGEREQKRTQIQNHLGFHPDFLELWGEYESIASGARWKVQKLLDLEINMHFDDDATEMKKYTDMWIMKVMNSGEISKF